MLSRRSSGIEDLLPLTAIARKTKSQPLSAYPGELPVGNAAKMPGVPALSGPVFEMIQKPLVIGCRRFNIGARRFFSKVASHLGKRFINSTATGKELELCGVDLTVTM
jgi:hypothetical protein